jgi:hypothetical protein
MIRKNTHKSITEENRKVTEDTEVTLFQCRGLVKYWESILFVYQFYHFKKEPRP